MTRTGERVRIASARIWPSMERPPKSNRLLSRPIRLLSPPARMQISLLIVPRVVAFIADRPRPHKASVIAATTSNPAETPEAAKLRANFVLISYSIGVDNTRQIRNLALIGFMGTGKTTVGRLAADILHFTFLDTDDVIEGRTGLTVTQIFERQGEAAFRELERRLVEELTRRKKTVISAGGGLPLPGPNLASLKTHALVVCLWASPEKIWDRVRSQTHRSLLNEPDPLAKIHQLLEVRGPHYRQADVLVNTEMRSLREVAAQVVHQFHMAQAAHR